MVCYFIGGALGSALGSMAWRHYGWIGVCAFGFAATGLAGLNHWRGRGRSAQAA
jgi:hypothetical protein